MNGAIGEGYVASSSDGGIGMSYTPDPWALASPGNVNLYALQDFASAALNDQVGIDISFIVFLLIKFRLCSRKHLLKASTADQRITRTGVAARKVVDKASCSPNGTPRRTMVSRPPHLQ